MRSPSLQHPMLRSLSALAALVAFAACGADSPLDPSTEPTAAAPTETAAVTPAASDNLAALITSQRIAWTSYRTGWTELYKMDQLGIQSTQLTTLKTLLQGPAAWSWDSKQLATIRYRGVDAFHGHNDVWVINADGSNGHWARAQPSAFDFYTPSWSPDGSRIVMTVDVKGTKTLGWMEPATGKAGLFWLPGGGAVLGRDPSYNKAGTKIIYVGPTGFTVDQINPDGSGHVVRISPNAWVSHPLFSPVGNKISYELGASPGNIDIYVKNFGTGVTTRLTWNAAVDRFASWSPDGAEMVFMSNRTGKDQIYTMNAAAGGGVLRITHTSVEEWAPSWAH